MKLEVGKKYKARNGDIFQITDTVKDSIYSFRGKGSSFGVRTIYIHWSKDGHFLRSKK